jgi:hypothetical protein
LKTAGTLKSDLNFEVWRQLVSAGVTIVPAHGAIALGVPLMQESRGNREGLAQGHWIW